MKLLNAQSSFGVTLFYVLFGVILQGDSSDDEALKEEEEEILRLQRERNKDMSMADFGLQNVSEESEDDSERELTLEVNFLHATRVQYMHNRHEN